MATSTIRIPAKDPADPAPTIEVGSRTAAAMGSAPVRVAGTAKKNRSWAVWPIEAEEGPMGPFLITLLAQTTCKARISCLMWPAASRNVLARALAGQARLILDCAQPLKLREFPARIIRAAELTIKRSQLIMD